MVVNLVTGPVPASYTLTAGVVVVNRTWMSYTNSTFGLSFSDKWQHGDVVAL